MFDKYSVVAVRIRFSDFVYVGEFIYVDNKHQTCTLENVTIVRLSNGEKFHSEIVYLFNVISVCLNDTEEEVE